MNNFYEAKHEIELYEIAGKVNKNDDENKDIRQIASNIKLIAMDVDGVLTDGGLCIGDTGEVQKVFDAKDGMGISCAIKSGIEISLITGRKSFIVNFRGNELGIKDIRGGIHDKAEEIHKLATKFGIKEENIAYIGDDLNDLPAINVVGVSFAPSDAISEVKSAVDYVAANSGGKGAVREIIELILKSQGKWKAIVDSYSKKGQGDKQ